MSGRTGSIHVHPGNMLRPNDTGRSYDQPDPADLRDLRGAGVAPSTRSAAPRPSPSYVGALARGPRRGIGRGAPRQLGGAPATAGTASASPDRRALLRRQHRRRARPARSASRPRSPTPREGSGRGGSSTSCSRWRRIPRRSSFPPRPSRPASRDNTSSWSRTTDGRIAAGHRGPDAGPADVVIARGSRPRSGRDGRPAPPRAGGEGRGQTRSGGPLVNFSEIFIRRPVTTTLIMLAILLFGVVAYRSCRSPTCPTSTSRRSRCRAGLPGASPETMASSVATPLEQQFSTIAGLDSMTSTERLGSTHDHAAVQPLARHRRRRAGRPGGDRGGRPAAAAGHADAAHRTRRSTRPTRRSCTSRSRRPTLPLSTLDEYGQTMMAQRISTVLRRRAGAGLRLAEVRRAHPARPARARRARHRHRRGRRPPCAAAT